jgi:hypothetical protein
MTSLTQALPLTRGIDNQLQFLLVEYMTTVNVWTRQIFGSAQYSYIKDDLASVQRPSIFVYPMISDKNSWAYSETGRIMMELHFSLKMQRVDLAQNIIQIANDIKLMNWNQDFTTYMQPLCPGLFWFGKYCHVDYTRVYAKEAVVKMEFDWKVDMQAWLNEQQSQGYDITSPDVMIYPPATALMENLAILNSDQTVAFETNPS